MKKKLKSYFPPSGKYLKLFKVLKLCLIFSIVFSLNVNAAVKLQNLKLDVSYKNESLQNIIYDLEKKINLVCFYNVKDVSQVTNITMKLRNVSVKEIFNRALKGTKLVYTITNNAIVIKKGQVPDKADKKEEAKGIVKDTEGNILPGVSVVIKGTNIGVSTDAKGRFAITIPEEIKKPVLIFSFIGLKNKEVAVSFQKEMKVVLSEKKEKLEEVIVNGFKSVKKSHYTGNATVVSKKELLKTNPRSVMEALQVFDPSFRIRENSNWGSDPNALPEFNIRGESSMGSAKGVDVEIMKQTQRVGLENNPNLPIFILDGFEVSIQKIYDMDMNRIENITILKDAAATSLYGSRAANGVVMVTTVAPQPGKLRLNYNVNMSAQLPDLSDYNLAKGMEKFDAEVFAGVYEPANEGMIIDALLKYYGKYNMVKKGYDTDWMYQPLQNAFNHKHSVFIEGGSDNIRYGFDVTYDKNRGVMKGSFRDRKGVGFTFDYKYKGLRIKNKVSYLNTQSEDSPYGNFNEYANMCPYYPIHDENGEIIKDYDTQYFKSGPSPLAKTLLENFYGRTNYNNITNNLSLYYDFSPALRFTTQLSIQKIDSKVSSFIDPSDIRFEGKHFREKGQLDENYKEQVYLNYKSLLTFKKGFGGNFINIVTGVQVNTRKQSSNKMRYKGFQTGHLHEPQHAAMQPTKTDHYEDEQRLVGFIGSFNYSYKDTYLLDGSFRMDGSSRFGTEKRFAPFWSIGAGINMHKLGPFKDLVAISRLKIRGSYGSLGKVNFPAHNAISTYVFDNNIWYKTGGQSYLLALGNDELKWETTNTMDCGIDLGLFNGKINIKASYYTKETVDLITDFYLRHSSGFNSYKINSGAIENTGYELSLNARVLRTENLIANIFGNLASNKNKITELSEAVEEYNKQLNEVYYSTAEEYQVLVTRPLQKYYVGASTSAIYAVRSVGIDPSNGMEKFIKKNGMSTYTYCVDDQVVVGDKLPDLQGSFGFNVGYKGFFANASFIYSYGSQIYNQTIRSKIEDVDILNNNVDKRVLTDRWKKPGDIVPYLDIKAGRDSRPTSRFVQDNNYIAFNSLSVGYDFQTKLIKKWGLSKLGLKLNLNDLARWSTVKQERGIYYPYARNYSLNLNLSF